MLILYRSSAIGVEVGDAEASTLDGLWLGAKSCMITDEQSLFYGHPTLAVLAQLGANKLH